MPSDLQNVDRDVFNEKPSKEDIIAVPEGQGINVTNQFDCYRFLMNISFFFFNQKFLCRLSKTIQCGYDTYNTWRYSYKIVWCRVSEKC